MPEEVSAQATKDPSVEPAELERVERGQANSSSPGDDPAEALAPGTAFRAAFDEAQPRSTPASRRPRRRGGGGSRSCSGCSGSWRGQAAPRRRPRAARAPGRRAGRHAGRPARRCAAQLGGRLRGGAAAENGNGNGDEDDDAAAAGRRRGRVRRRAGAPLTMTLDFELDDEDEPTTTRPTRTTRTTTPSRRRRRRRRRRGGGRRRRGRAAPRSGRRPALPLQASDGIGQDGRRRGLRRRREDHRRPDPHPPPAAGRPVQSRPDARRATAGASARRSSPASAGPRRPPVTIETYAWFIRNAELLNRDVYGVVLCDEAHTALGEKTRRASIRAVDSPIYIGMTATDQLLQKHVGDVFPAEVADFPLAEAVRKGVVAPLRAVRVKPGASLKRRPHRRRRLRPAGAGRGARPRRAEHGGRDVLPDMFGDRPGIVYAAGVDHADRVAAAMRAIGPEGRRRLGPHAAARAGDDAGRVRARRDQRAGQCPAPRRGLERTAGDGLHAPRADGLERVYQQRLGRIMRLHRRKEAGVVVDFAEATAPHTDRTVTVHSLLGVDAYHPARWSRRRRRAGVSAGDGWRGHSCARRPGSCRSPPTRRGEGEIILEEWKLVAVERLPPEEQVIWAENAGRRASGEGPREARGRPAVGATGDADDVLRDVRGREQHRGLRLMALGDLAQRPTRERLRTGSAPDRGSSDLAARPQSGLPDAPARPRRRASGGLGTPAGGLDLAPRTGEPGRPVPAGRIGARERARPRALALREARRRCGAVRRGADAIVMELPLDLGAAILAIVLTNDVSASRILESARECLSADAPPWHRPRIEHPPAAGCAAAGRRQRPAAKQPPPGVAEPAARRARRGATPAAGPTARPR